MPLSTYENIIPQRGEIVKRLTAVFKKIRGVFLFGRRAFFTPNLVWVISVKVKHREGGGLERKFPYI